jgi:hypothetical protein
LIKKVKKKFKRDLDKKLLKRKIFDWLKGYCLKKKKLLDRDLLEMDYLLTSFFPKTKN